MESHESTVPAGISRREFAKTSAAVGLGSLLPDTAGAWFQGTAAGKVRYAIVGLGSRSQMYQQAVNETFAQQAELVACCDVNAGRLELAKQTAVAAKRPAPALYAAAATRLLRGRGGACYT